MAFGALSFQNFQPNKPSRLFAQLVHFNVFSIILLVTLSTLGHWSQVAYFIRWLSHLYLCKIFYIFIIEMSSRHPHTEIFVVKKYPSSFLQPIQGTAGIICSINWPSTNINNMIYIEVRRWPSHENWINQLTYSYKYSPAFNFWKWWKPSYLFSIYIPLFFFFNIKSGKKNESTQRNMKNITSSAASSSSRSCPVAIGITSSTFFFKPASANFQYKQINNHTRPNPRPHSYYRFIFIRTATDSTKSNNPQVKSMKIQNKE